jgi:hypothetical protein
MVDFPRRSDYAVEARRLNPHVALSVAAALAYRQLSDHRQFYDIQHYGDVLNMVARALSRVAPIYVGDETEGAPRALNEIELEGATLQRGATLLLLVDGRVFRNLSVLRVDLRDAIAVLGRTGLKSFGAQREAE